ncbi:MAG: thiol reductant ABC exporter subunit CydC [Neomegalonema sp.]|nr:thiol reductant ABC exporter subunit CydC [Neomegalonema sp.]
MKHLWTLFAAFRASHGRRLLLGALLAVLASASAAALLGLSGWFITATAIAGAAGVGIAFDVFRPGAGVRFFALSRTAARYGERLATHDATLRFLAELRGAVYRGLAQGPWSMIGRLRRGEALSRLTADVDALDGFYLRLLLPISVAALTLTLGAAALWWFAGLEVAVLTIAPLALAGGLGVRFSARRGARAARRRLAALDAIRLRTVDLMSATPEYAAAGRLDAQRAAIDAAAMRAAEAEAELRRLDIWVGGAVAFSGDLSIALALWSSLSIAGVEAPIAALAALTALGLLETIAPLRRGALEYGALALAARRIAPRLQMISEPPHATPPTAAAAAAAGLAFNNISFAYAPTRAPVLSGLTLEAQAGEIIALEGASGSGKSTILALAARIAEPSDGYIQLNGAPLAAWPEAALRQTVGYLPQRSELLGTTLADALRLGAPDASDDALWEVLRAVEMEEAAQRVGGLEARLGAGAVGFSGGETRRLAFARLLLRRPNIALLDEPTEGLAADQAERVLTQALRHLDGAAIIIASHRAEERALADRVIRLS